MRTVTALHPERRDRVRIELDGEPWRTLPAAAIVSAGLRIGTTLDRPRARELRRALRRTAARDTAARALSRRDRSTAELAAQLELRGIGAPERIEAIESMKAQGYLDDSRFAAGRAAALAARGYGDEAIRFDLDGRGLDDDCIAGALAQLEPEPARAAAIAGEAGTGMKAVRTLAAKGFSTEAIESAVDAMLDGA